MDFQEQIQGFLHCLPPHLCVYLIWHTYDVCDRPKAPDPEPDPFKRCLNHIYKHEECQRYLLDVFRIFS